MSTTTINITLPKRLKEEMEKRVESGMYSSISEFIRNAVRITLTSGVDLPYGEGFSSEAENEILKAEAQAVKHPKKYVESESEITKMFKD